jgi:dCMP deaminase
MNHWDRRFLKLVREVSSWSKDPSTQVGAIIVDPHHRVVSLGFNGLPRGVHDLPDRLEQRETKLKMVIHAEENALLFASRSVEGHTLYVWPLPCCARCAAKVIQAGIARVVSLPSAHPRLQEDFVLAAQMYSEAGVALELIDESLLADPAERTGPAET